MKFGVNMYVDKRMHPIEFQVHTSKVKVTGPYYRIFHHCEIGQKTCGHDNSWIAVLS